MSLICRVHVPYSCDALIDYTDAKSFIPIYKKNIENLREAVRTLEGKKFPTQEMLKSTYEYSDIFVREPSGFRINWEKALTEEKNSARKLVIKEAMEWSEKQKKERETAQKVLQTIMRKIDEENKDVDDLRRKLERIVNASPLILVRVNHEYWHGKVAVYVKSSAGAEYVEKIAKDIADKAGRRIERIRDIGGASFVLAFKV